MSVSILLLAAGGSTRMRGGDKLLEVLDGEPLLTRSARTALASRAEEVIAVLGANRVARETALADLPIRTVQNENWREGMGRSIAVGAAAVSSGSHGIMVMPSDMPGLTPALLDQLIMALPLDDPGMILRPCTVGGKLGNPVLFGAKHRSALMALTGDTGARAVIAANPSVLRYVEDAGTGVLIDLDTPEAWATYRAGIRAHRDD